MRSERDSERLSKRTRERERARASASEKERKRASECERWARKQATESYASQKIHHVASGKQMGWAHGGEAHRAEAAARHRGRSKCGRKNIRGIIDGGLYYV